MTAKLISVEASETDVVHGKHTINPLKGYIHSSSELPFLRLIILPLIIAAKVTIARTLDVLFRWPYKVGF